TLGLVGRYDESLEATRTGLMVRERLLERRPGDRPLRLLNAHTYNNLGTNELDRGHLGEARPLLEQALALYEQLLRAEQADPAGRQDQPVGTGPREAVPGPQFNLGLLSLYGDRPAEAVRWFGLARTAWEQLCRDNPAAAVYRLRLVQVDNQLGAA